VSKDIDNTRILSPSPSSSSSFGSQFLVANNTHGDHRVGSMLSPKCPCHQRSRGRIWGSSHGDGLHHSVDLDPDRADDVLDRSAIACSTSKEIDQRRVQEWQTLVSNLSTRVSLSHHLTALDAFMFTVLFFCWKIVRDANIELKVP